MTAESNLTLKGRIFALAAGCVLLVAVSEAVLRVVFPHWNEFSSARFIVIETIPGKGAVGVGRANFDGFFAQNNGDFRVRISINEFGLRNPEPIKNADGRLWVVGDSMTFGWGVEQNEMYSSRLAGLSGVPTYNVASPGTDLCGYQMLVARMPKDAHPRAVLLGLVLENDLRVYDCLAEWAGSATKPENPAPTVPSMIDVKSYLLGHSALYSFFTVSLKRVGFLMPLLRATGLVAKEHIKTTEVDIGKFKSVISASADEIIRLRNAFPSSVPFAVLIMPARFEIRDNDPYYRHVRESIVLALESRKIDVIDPLVPFREAGFAPTHFRHDGHWSALGHEIAAKESALWARKAIDLPAGRKDR